MRTFDVECFGRAMMLVYSESEVRAEDAKAAKKIANTHAREKGFQPVHFEANEIFDTDTVKISNATPCSCGFIPDEIDWTECPRCGLLRGGVPPEELVS